MEYEEHWRKGARSAMSNGKVEPLTYHYAAAQLGTVTIALTFDQDKQSWLDALLFNDGTTFKEIAYGHGRIFWVGYQVELAEGGCRLALLPNLRRPVPWPAG